VFDEAKVERIKRKNGDLIGAKGRFNPFVAGLLKLLPK
jgi:hypothetical protein